MALAASGNTHQRTCHGRQACCWELDLYELVSIGQSCLRRFPRFADQLDIVLWESLQQYKLRSSLGRPYDQLVRDSIHRSDVTGVRCQCSCAPGGTAAEPLHACGFFESSLRVMCRLWICIRVLYAALGVWTIELRSPSHDRE